MAAVMNPFHPSHNNNSMSDITPASSIPTVHLPNPLLAYFLNRFPSSSSPSPTTSSHGDDATDWRSRCLQVEQMLSDTQTELDEFTRASKELEEEMERDLERNENEKEQLRARVSKLEGDRDDWKVTLHISSPDEFYLLSSLDRRSS